MGRFCEKDSRGKEVSEMEGERNDKLNVIHRKVMYDS